jgi:hypothetical protein
MVRDWRGEEGGAKEKREGLIREREGERKGMDEDGNGEENRKVRQVRRNGRERGKKCGGRVGEAEGEGSTDEEGEKVEPRKQNYVLSGV